MAPGKGKFFDTKMILLLAALAILSLSLLSFGIKSLDQRLYYTGAEARAFFAGLSAQDIANYRLTEIFDFAFIGLYTFALVLAFSRLHPRSPLLYWIAFAPAVFDIIETGCILQVLNFGETFSLLNWLGIATFLKWISGATAIALLIKGAIRRAAA